MKGIKHDVTIGIGEYYASSDDIMIYTLLGSCVAVCLFDPDNHIGGMNHILMPGEPQIGRPDASARYGINAMELLINAIMKLGGNRKKLIAKTFGGANVIASIPEERAIGGKIAHFVVDFLSTEKIPIVNRDFGGYDTRKVYFHTATGDVYLKRVASMKSVVKTEQQKLDRIKKELHKPGDITLFMPE